MMKTSSNGAQLRNKKSLGLTMLGLLFIDSINQGLAHGAGGGWNAMAGPVGAPSPNHAMAHQSWGLGTAFDIGKSHGSVSLAPQAANNAGGFAALQSQVKHHQSFVPVAQTMVVPRTSLFTTEVGQAGRSLSLDLTSTANVITLGAKLFNGAPNVTIEVGGTKETFTAGAKVTAGEYVAIQQVLNGGAQGVKLSHNGAATGGTFSLNAVDSSNVTALVIPKNVVAIDDFTRSGVVTVNGDLTYL